jgi:hypothetical protein
MDINIGVRFACAATLVLSAACSGKIGEPGGWITGSGDFGTGSHGSGSAGSGGSSGSGTSGTGGSGFKEWEPLPCDTHEQAFAPARVWQLTDQEYVNVVTAVLGVTLTGTDAEITTAASNSGVYTNMSEGSSITLPSAKNYQLAANKVAQLATTGNNLQTLLGLASATTTPTTVQVQSFITTKVARLWRRPVSSDEVSALMDIYTKGLPDGIPRAFQLLVQAALQVPSFLYRTELGADGAATGASPFSITSFELASALSFFFTESSPDDVLWSKAVDGTLTDPTVLDGEVTRLLALSDVQANLSLKASYWLGTESLPTRIKSSAMFPEYTASVKDALYQSITAFVRDVVWNGQLGDLFSSQKVYVNAELGALYDIPGASGTDLAPIVVSAPERSAGLLTQPGLLAAANKWDGPGDPIHRGLFVYNALICGGNAGAIGDPPADAPTIAASMTGTERQKAQQRAMLSCGGCHGLMDPLGLTFERYDAIGRYSETRYVYRDQQNNNELSWRTSPTPIDTSATLSPNLGQDIAGPVAGINELATTLDRLRRRVAHCAGTHMATFSLGHDPGAENSCGLQQAKDLFYKTGSFSAFFRALVTSPGFLTRDPGTK